MKMPREAIKELIRNEKFSNTNEIMEAIKSMFSEVLEETLQCELDKELGYEKHERTGVNGEKNYRNGTTKRKLRTQIGEVEINVPRDRNGEYEPKVIEKYQRSADGLDEKILSLYAHGKTGKPRAEKPQGFGDRVPIFQFVRECFVFCVNYKNG